MSNYILLVEDDIDSQTVITQISNHLEYSIDVAGSAEEAEAYLNEHGQDYDLVIIDLRLPGQNGWQLLNSIKENHQFNHIRCIAVTGYSDNTVEREALAAGFDYFLAKPVTANKLVDVFNQVLS